LAAVDELHYAIEEEDVGGAGGLVGAGYLLGFVVEVGKAEAEALGLLAEAFGAVVGVVFSVVAADGDDVDGLGDVVASQVRQAPFDVLDVGAVSADEEDEKRLLAAEVGEADGFAGDDVGEREVGGGGAEFEHGGFGECHGCLVERLRRFFKISEFGCCGELEFCLASIHANCGIEG